MTKFLLHGGATGKDTHRNKIFFNEMVKYLGDNATLLLVYFARNKKDWDKLFKEDCIKFTTDKNIHLEVADENIGILTEQIICADALFIRGGDTNILLSKFEEIKNLRKILRNKIIGVSSAGAYIFSRYYYSFSMGKITKGLNILPLKIFCHYATNYNDAFQELERYGEDLEVLKIEEGDFVEYVIN